jgi:hypothetical protein
MAITGGGTKLVWNLYITPPSTIPIRNREWQGIISSLTFLTALSGAGVARKSGMACSRCKSINHLTSLCPFPKQEGWIISPNLTNKGTSTSIEQVFSTSTQRGRGYRNRGEVRGQRERGWRGRGN